MNNRKLNSKRLLVTVGIIAGLLILFGVGYLMARLGMESVYDMGVIANSFWNTFFLALMLGMFLFTVSIFIKIFNWVFPRKPKNQHTR